MNNVRLVKYSRKKSGMTYNTFYVEKYERLWYTLFLKIGWNRKIESCEKWIAEKYFNRLCGLKEENKENYSITIIKEYLV